MPLSNGHYFGTDVNGRDLFVRTLHGGRISLVAGVLATLISLVIGAGVGTISGYLGGRFDVILMQFTNIIYALPFVFFVVLMSAYFGNL